MDNAPKIAKVQTDFLLLDASSSMSDDGKWFSSLSAIEAYIRGMKAERVNSQIMVSKFTCSLGGDIQMTQLVNIPIDEWEVHTQGFGRPSGMTPLYDAINVMGRQLRDLDPKRCAITIVTDGQESGSKFTDIHQAKAILDWCRAKGWQVTFIGADFANDKLARALGAPEGSFIGVAKANLALATSALAKKRAAYGLHGTDMHYSEGERQQFGGYLAGPSK